MKYIQLKQSKIAKSYLKCQMLRSSFRTSFSETNSERYQTDKMERFAKIVNSWKQVSEYVSVFIQRAPNLVRSIKAKQGAKTGGRWDLPCKSTEWFLHDKKSIMKELKELVLRPSFLTLEPQGITQQTISQTYSQNVFRNYQKTSFHQSSKNGKNTKEW